MGWLIAYDIADPRRWRRVHAAVAREGHRLQLSLYWLPGDTPRARALAEHLRDLIDPGADDVRFYAFPDHAWCRLWGPRPWDEGITTPFSRRFAPHWRPGMPVAPAPGRR